MPDFFSFTQGTETNPRFRTSDASPLLGRFRAVPQPAHHAHGRRNSLLTAGWRGSVHVGYGALLARELEEEEDVDDDDDTDGSDGDDGGIAWGGRLLRRTLRRMHDLWVSPKAGAVRKAADKWWTRWTLLVVLPAMLVRLVSSPGVQ